MAAVTATTAFYGFSESKRAGREARRQSERQAQLGERTTREQVRNLDQTEQTFMGELPAGAVASGVEADSKSVLAVASEAAKRFRRERRYIEDVGEQSAQITRQQGRNQQRAYNAQAVTGLLKGLTQAAQQASSAGGFWKV